MAKLFALTGGPEPELREGEVVQIEGLATVLDGPSHAAGRLLVTNERLIHVPLVRNKIVRKTTQRRLEIPIIDISSVDESGLVVVGALPFTKTFRIRCSSGNSYTIQSPTAAEFVEVLHRLPRT